MAINTVCVPHGTLPCVDVEGSGVQRLGSALFVKPGVIARQVRESSLGSAVQGEGEHVPSQSETAAMVGWTAVRY